MLNQSRSGASEPSAIRRLFAFGGSVIRGFTVYVYSMLEFMLIGHMYNLNTHSALHTSISSCSKLSSPSQREKARKQ